MIGTLLSIGVGLVVLWSNTASLPLDVQLDMAVLTLMLGLFVVIGQIVVIATDASA